MCCVQYARAHVCVYVHSSFCVCLLSTRILGRMRCRLLAYRVGNHSSAHLDHYAFGIVELLPISCHRKHVRVVQCTPCELRSFKTSLCLGKWQRERVRGRREPSGESDEKDRTRAEYAAVQCGDRSRAFSAPCALLSIMSLPSAATAAAAAAEAGA